MLKREEGFFLFSTTDRIFLLVLAFEFDFVAHGLRWSTFHGTQRLARPSFTYAQNKTKISTDDVRAPPCQAGKASEKASLTVTSSPNDLARRILSLSLAPIMRRRLFPLIAAGLLPGE
jgi:hypothetical protein